MPSTTNRRYFPSSPSQTSFLSSHSHDRTPGDSSSSSRLSNGSSSSFSRSGSINYVARSNRSTASVVPSISDKFSLAADPSAWGTAVSPNFAEPDDALHEVTGPRDKSVNQRGNIFTVRGLTNLGCIVLLGVCLIALFAGYPIISYFTRHPLSTLGGFNFGGINATGQVPSISGNWGLIDIATPDSARTITSFNDGGKQYELVFSDEFNVDGRSFYPGDDPYWEAVDLHYWQTGNLEWYDPAAITTSNGSLKITLSQKDTHGLNFQGGMLSTWNKFCFTGGLVLASVTLPGDHLVHGFWPAVWTMGNLGRAGYGASLEGMWPYSYDSCDVGTVANQSVKGVPYAATINGDPYNNDAFSYLPGQRLSRCTCPGESHPGPMHEDGTYVGRSAPEIDIFEATVANNIGLVSQSGQWAPFDAGYQWNNDSTNQVIVNPDITSHNNYEGGAYQMATSALSTTNQDCYERGGTGCFAVYGFEYKPGFGDAYISWINNGQLAWTLNVGGVGVDTAVEIQARPIPQEPMYIIANLGMSTSFGGLDTTLLTFPATMSIDWIRVYQPTGQKNIGCDPPNFPTAAYIAEYSDAYANPNLTIWQTGKGGYNQTFPKNKFLGQC